MDLDAFFTINNAISVFANRYLRKRGWYHSLGDMPRNGDGYVPWITYPSFVQLCRIVKPTHKVFEFGGGASSLWWASKVSQVITVDHDAAWIEKLKAEKPANLTLIAREINSPCPPEHQRILEPFFDLNLFLPITTFEKHNIEHGLVNREFTGYVAELLKYPKGTFDIICVDGMARALSAWIAADYLKDPGIIVFDNVDRWQYNSTYQMLSKKGFRRIDFYGPGPSRADEWCTSIFAKNLDFFANNIDSPQGDSDLPW